MESARAFARRVYRYCTGKKTPGGAGTHTRHTEHADAQRLVPVKRHRGECILVPAKRHRVEPGHTGPEKTKKTPGGAGTHMDTHETGTERQV